MPPMRGAVVSLTPEQRAALETDCGCWSCAYQRDRAVDAALATIDSLHIARVEAEDEASALRVKLGKAEAERDNLQVDMLSAHVDARRAADRHVAAEARAEKAEAERDELKRQVSALLPMVVLLGEKYQAAMASLSHEEQTRIILEAGETADAHDVVPDGYWDRLRSRLNGGLTPEQAAVIEAARAWVSDDDEDRVETTGKLLHSVAKLEAAEGKT